MTAMGTDREARPAIRVLVADGQALIRAGLRNLLETGRDIAVVAEASTGDEALATACRTRPDVVLMDLNLPGPGGVETTHRLVARSPGGVNVLILSPDAPVRDVCAVLRAGASGVLRGTADGEELIRAVRAVAAGHALLSPSITRGLIAQLTRLPRAEPSQPSLLDQLTDREREVVALVAHGLTNEQIANRLVVSPATAKTHVSRAMVKLRARDRSRLVVLAYECGLVLPPTPQATPQVSP
jgi:DNA-binding NarL/FixJ family response regulator